MTNLPTKTTLSAPSMLMDAQGFDQLYRVGRMLASSVLFPEHLRKGTPDQAAANGALIMNMAMRLNEDPLTVAQQIYFVGGKPGWSTSYLISKANQHGVFENPIDWDITGSGGELSVTAHATLAATKKRVSFTCDMAMAKAEDWTKSKKYQSMPELMLRYRSAAALIRLYCPEVMIGVPAQIEVELGEMRDITPPEYQSASPAKPAPVKAKDKEEAPGADAAEAEIVDPDEERGEKPGDDTAKTDKPDAKTEPADAGKGASDESPDQGGESQAQKRAVDPAQYKALYDMILRDLDDAPGVQDVLDLYGPQIESMQAVNPDLYAALQAEIEKYRESEQAP